MNDLCTRLKITIPTPNSITAAAAEYAKSPHEKSPVPNTPYLNASNIPVSDSVASDERFKINCRQIGGMV